MKMYCICNFDEFNSVTVDLGELFPYHNNSPEFSGTTRV